MMRGHVTEHYTGYLDGSLPEALHREVEAHLHACSQCAAELAEMRALTDCLHAMPAVPVPPRFAAGVRARIEAQPARRPFAWWRPVMTSGMAVAAALLILVVGRVGMTPISRPADTRPSTKTNEQPSDAKAGRSDYAALPKAEDTNKSLALDHNTAAGAEKSLAVNEAGRADNGMMGASPQTSAPRPIHDGATTPKPMVARTEQHDLVANTPREDSGFTSKAMPMPSTAIAEADGASAPDSRMRTMTAAKAMTEDDGYQQQLTFATLEARASADLRQLTLHIESRAEATLAVEYAAVYQRPEQSFALAVGKQEIPLTLAAQDDGAVITLRLRSRGQDERFYLIIPGDGAREPAVNVVLREQAPREVLVYLAHQAGVAVLCSADFADAAVTYGTAKTPPLTALRRLADDQGYQVALAHGVANLTRRP